MFNTSIRIINCRIIYFLVLLPIFPFLTVFFGKLSPGSQTFYQKSSRVFLDSSLNCVNYKEALGVNIIFNSSSLKFFAACSSDFPQGTESDFLLHFNVVQKTNMYHSNFQNFALNLNESNSLHIFCQDIFPTHKNLKITSVAHQFLFKEILPYHNYLWYKLNLNKWMAGWFPTRFYDSRYNHSGMMERRSFSFHLLLRLLSTLFILVTRLSRGASSIYLEAVYYKGPPLLTRYVRRRLKQYIHLCKPSVCHSLYFYLLLVLSGDIHPNPGPIFPSHPRHLNNQSLIVGAWNVRTLLERKRSHMRPTAIVARVLNEYKIDICALSETRLHGEHKIEEAGAGYTFFLNGRSPDNPPQIHGVGFAIRSDLVAQLNGKLSTGINERLMTLSLPIQGGKMHIVSAYAPTMAQSHAVKEQFYL